MQYIEAVNYAGTKYPSIFLAGGISGVKDDWQAKAVLELADIELLTIFNPRRKNFPMDDPTAAEEQITWEHKMLYRADAISFRFPPDTLCPITLYELGAWSAWRDPAFPLSDPKRLFISVHPKYARLKDIQIQTKLARPDVQVVVEETFSTQPIREWLVPSPAIV